MHGPSGEVVKLTVPRATPHLRLVRKVVALAAQQLDFPPEDVDKIELAVDEACSNAIMHAEPLRAETAPQIHLEVWLSPDALTVVLKDGGEPFAFDGKGAADMDVEQQLDSPDRGGLGIYMMRQLMDQVGYEHSPADGNVITLLKRLPVAAAR
jgi:serine/threonine-protein kinase RsbW